MPVMRSVMTRSPLGELPRRQCLPRVHEPLHDDADEQSVQDRASLACHLGVLLQADPQEELLEASTTIAPVPAD